METSGGALRRWLLPLALLLLVLLSFRLEVAAYRFFQGSPAASALEALRPADYMDPAEEKSLIDASRGSIVEALSLLQSPGNPLGLEPQEQMAVRHHSAKLSELADHALYHQFRLVEALGESALRRHQQNMMDQLGTLRTSGARWELVDQLMVARCPDLRERIQSLPTGMPDGWTPQAEPELYARWKATFGDGSHDLPSDAFLSHQVRAVAVFQFSEGHKLSDDEAYRFAASVSALREHTDSMLREWILLYRVAVAPHPDRVGRIDLGPRRPDLTFNQMADGLREAANRQP